jgi:hypothetical protein
MARRGYAVFGNGIPSVKGASQILGRPYGFSETRRVLHLKIGTDPSIRTYLQAVAL